MFFSKRNACIVGALLGLGGCAHINENVDGMASNKTQGSKNIEISVSDPWTVSAIHTHEGKVLLATASHRNNYLDIWEITRDRKSTHIARDNGTGYHPDGLRWSGESDIYVSGEGSSEIQHWTFTENKLALKYKIPVPHPPINLIPVDLDQDGKLDLISAPFAGNTLTLLWGTGNDKYQASDLAADKTPQNPRAADWNQDGKMDIIWTDYYAGSIRLALNQGERKFSTKLLQEKGPGTPRQLEIGDIDQDGHPDLVMALETGKAARILFNDGKGGVRPEMVEIPAPLYGYSAVTLTTIGGIPLLAMSENGRIVLARPKSGSDVKGLWDLRGLEAGDIPQNLTFFDLDQDGEMDLYFANTGGKTVQIHFGPLWENATPLP